MRVRDFGLTRVFLRFYSLWWGFHNVFDMRVGLENFVTFSKNFVKGLEAVVLGGDESDFLLRFRFMLEG